MTLVLTQITAEMLAHLAPVKMDGTKTEATLIVNNVNTLVKIVLILLPVLLVLTTTTEKLIVLVPMGIMKTAKFVLNVIINVELVPETLSLVKPVPTPQETLPLTVPVELDISTTELQLNVNNVKPPVKTVLMLTPVLLVSTTTTVNLTVLVPMDSITQMTLVNPVTTNAGPVPDLLLVVTLVLTLLEIKEIIVPVKLHSSKIT